MSGREMTLQKLGGSYQLVLDTPEDLVHICDLDDAFWMVNSALSDSFTCEKTFLNYLDSDDNGIIRTDEVRNAKDWLFQVLSDRSRMSKDNESLKLSTIDASNAEGKAIKETSEWVLSNLRLLDSDEITLEQIRSRKEILSMAACNGDGIIPPEAVEDAEVSQLIKDIMDSVGSVDDASGKKGISKELFDKFKAESKAYLEWKAKGEISDNGKDSELMFRGSETVSAYNSFIAVKAKIDEYFTLCLA